MTGVPDKTQNDDLPGVRYLPIESDQGATTRTLCLANVQAEAIRWLWKPRIALGKVSLIVGDPGLSKSTLTLDAAARVTKGTPWPDGTPCPKGAVVMLSAEDDAADTIRPRLDAAGGDPSQVFILQAIREPDGDETRERSFSLLKDVERLREEVDAVGARLVIVDPVSAYLGKIDSNNNADVRSALAPLERMASEARCTVLAVSHLNKNSTQTALQRISGSLAFTAAARAVHAVTRDQEDEDRRLFLPVKNNLGNDRDGMAYRVVTASNGAPRLQWETDPVSVSADEAMAPAMDADEREERDDAVSWLRDYLADGPRHAKEVFRDADEAGFPKRTIQRARKRAGAEIERAGYQKGTRWYLREVDHSSSLSESGADGTDGADGQPRGFQKGNDPSHSCHSCHSRQASERGMNGANGETEGEL